MKNLRATLITGAAVGAAAIGGGAIASAASSSTSTTSTTSSSAPTGHAPANMPAHGTAAHEDAEKTVTGTAADKAKAAAIKAEGGGTAGTVTTDFTGDGYEVTITKTNGSKVEVHLDKSFKVMQGPGGPGMHGPGGPGGPVHPAGTAHPAVPAHPAGTAPQRFRHPERHHHRLIAARDEGRPAGRALVTAVARQNACAVGRMRISFRVIRFGRLTANAITSAMS